MTAAYRHIIRTDGTISPMPDDPAHAWQHPWLRVSHLIRGITGTYWSAEVWPEAKKALG